MCRSMLYDLFPFLKCFYSPHAEKEQELRSIFFIHSKGSEKNLGEKSLKIEKIKFLIRY